MTVMSSLSLGEEESWGRGALGATAIYRNMCEWEEKDFI